MKRTIVYEKTFIATGSGVVQNARVEPCDKFSLQVKGVGAAATAWEVALKLSNDGVNWTTFLSHKNGVQADGELLTSGPNRYPALFFKAEVVGLTLGAATGISVIAVGNP
jgi:hypothetical protein